MPSAEPVLLLERAGGVATITLNRPAARNALSLALLRRLREAMVEVGSDEEIGAVVLTGADPAFCAGLDLKELSAGSQLLTEDGGVPAGTPWVPVPKPLIGAVNGAAVTGGFELALNCDFLIASERAVFADTHARVGIMPGWGLSFLLPERVGFPMARRMSFTGDFIDAQQALQAGLVTEVVAHEELLPAAHRLALTIASNNRVAVTALRESYRRIEGAAIGEAKKIEQDTGRVWRTSGSTAGIAERVSGVIERGREQTRR